MTEDTLDAVKAAIFNATNVDRDWTMDPELSQVADRFSENLASAGYQIVPVKPSEAMRAALRVDPTVHADGSAKGHIRLAVALDGYAAMLAAAKAAP